MSTTTPIHRDDRRRELAAATGQTVFTFDAPLWDVRDLDVSIRISPATVFAVAAGYTVALIGDGSAGATVTFATAPRPTGAPATTIALEGRMVPERTGDVTRSGAIVSRALELELDRTVVALQETRRDIDRLGQTDIVDLLAVAATLLGQASTIAATLAGLDPAAYATKAELTSGLSGKASTGDLAGKAATVHPHVAASITDFSTAVDARVAVGDLGYVGALGSGYCTGGGLAGGLLLDKNGWPWVTGAPPVNGSNAAASPNWQPMRVAIGEPGPALPFVKAVRSQGAIHLLDSAGAVYCAGRNTSGVLGRGDTTDRTALVRLGWFVTQGITITDIVVQPHSHGSSTGSTVYFLGSSSSISRGVWALGRNNNGQLGNGASGTSPVSTPVRCGTLTGITKVVAAGAADGLALALDDQARLWFWGSGVNGLAADGTTTDKTSPVITLTGVRDMAAQIDFASPTWYAWAIAVMVDRTVRTIGDGHRGQLGHGATTSSTAWLQPTIGFTTADRCFAFGGGTSGWAVVLGTDGIARVTGANERGQLGLGTTTDATSFQTPTFSGQGSISKLFAAGSGGEGATYALTSAGQLWAAGSGALGQLGTDTGAAPVSRSTFARIGVPHPSDTIADASIIGPTASSGAWGVIMLAPAGRAYVTGANGVGELGIGHTTSIDAVRRI